MSYDKYSQEYHLTHHGWIKGTYRYFFTSKDKKIERPAGCRGNTALECPAVV